MWCDVNVNLWSLRWQFTKDRYRDTNGIKVTVCHTAGHYGEEYGDWNRAVFMKRVFDFFRFRFMYKFVIL